MFDHEVHLRRARRVGQRFAAADFLHAAAAEAVAERLGDVNRAFPRVAIHGAGGGRFAAALRGVAGEEALVQTAFAPEEAALAAAHAPEAETRLTGIETPDLSPGGFELVVGGLILHRVADPVGVMTQMRLALKPDGLMIACLFAGETLSGLRAAFAEAEAELENGVSPRVAPMGEIRDLGALIQRAGFVMPVADVDRLDASFASPFHLMRDLRAMGEANALAGRRRGFTRRATMLRAAEIFAAHNPAAEGRVAARFEIAYLTGWAPGPDQPQALRPGAAKSRLASALGTPEIKTGVKAGD